MRLATQNFTDILPAEAPRLKIMTVHRLLNSLPLELKTPDNLALLKTYFLIPQPSVRHFVLVLFARITGDEDSVYPDSDQAQADYLIRHSAQLPTSDIRSKMLALVRQVSAANRSDVTGLYKAPDS